MRREDLRVKTLACVICKVRISYVGTLTTAGRPVFDEGSFTFKLKFGGASKKIIPGLSIGCRGARVGAKRRIVVPPQAGYGVER